MKGSVIIISITLCNFAVSGFDGHGDVEWF